MSSPDVGIAEALADEIEAAVHAAVQRASQSDVVNLPFRERVEARDVIASMAIDRIKASLRAATAPVAPVRGDGNQGAPEGWALVPIKPTPAMATAGDMYTNCGGACGNRAGAAAWAAMLCAAPKLPTPDSQQPEGKGDA